MIEFEKETHTYKVDGKILPSVTTIINILSSYDYKDIKPEILQRAAYKGSRVHKALEDLIVWGDYEIEPLFESYVEQFKKAKAVENFEIADTEFMLTNNEICGTIDARGILNESKTIVIDYKTTSTIHKKLLEAQFGGYKILCDANNIQVDEWYGLFLSKTGYKFIRIEPNVDIFNKCKEIYDYMKGE